MVVVVQVTAIDPMKRGLKVDIPHRPGQGARVTAIDPMKRGLKVYILLALPVYLCLVTAIDPMKRGLKGTSFSIIYLSLKCYSN